MKTAATSSRIATGFLRYWETGLGRSRNSQFAKFVGRYYRGWRIRNEIPVERFYDICLSFPADAWMGIDWGHSFGGLMNRVTVDGYGYPFEICIMRAM